MRNSLTLPFAITVLLLVSALGFGLWAFSERGTYKNNADELVAIAVTAAKAEAGAAKDKEHAEAMKSPYKTYEGPEQYGSVSVTYPKTWSAYVDTSGRGTAPMDGYFNPDVVPSLTDQSSSFALRVQVLNQSYSQALAQYENAEDVTVTPYSLPKVPKTVGVKLVGQLEEDVKGELVLLPLRDKTLQIFTQSQTYSNDFNNIILANLKFVP